MENDEVKALIRKMNELNSEIGSWGATNSQSNPGAVMHLRWMRKEVQKIEDKLKEIRLKTK